MTIVRSESGPIWRLTLNRPEARNAVSSPMLEELTRALGDAAVDPEARVVLLTGDGPDFCAGADLGELSEASGGASGMDYTVPLETFLTAVVEHPLPVIASIPGGRTRRWMPDRRGLRSGGCCNRRSPRHSVRPAGGGYRF